VLQYVTVHCSVFRCVSVCGNLNDTCLCMVACLNRHLALFLPLPDVAMHSASRGSVHWERVCGTHSINMYEPIIRLLQQGDDYMFTCIYKYVYMNMYIWHCDNVHIQHMHTNTSEVVLLCAVTNCSYLYVHAFINICIRGYI